jgi:hypothetical protein
MIYIEILSRPPYLEACRSLQAEQNNGVVYQDLLPCIVSRYSGIGHLGCSYLQQSVLSVVTAKWTNSNWSSIDSTYYSDLLNVCATSATSKTISAIFYAPSAFELFVFSLTAFRAWKDARLLTGASSAPFLVILYRGMSFIIYGGRHLWLVDGLVSFCVMFSVRMWNVWIVCLISRWLLLFTNIFLKFSTRPRQWAAIIWEHRKFGSLLPSESVLSFS